MGASRLSLLDQRPKSNEIRANSRITLVLYRRRAFRQKVGTSTVLRRAFDKAVRTKPPVIAADAGPMGIECGEDALSRCVGAVRRSAEDDTEHPRTDRRARLLLPERVETRGEEIASAARRKSTDRGQARNVFGLWTAVSCGNRDQSRRRTE